MNPAVGRPELLDAVAEKVRFRPPELMPKIAEPLQSGRTLPAHDAGRIIHPLESRDPLSLPVEQ